MPKKSYQELKRELDEVIVWFESSDIDLDKAVDKYGQGMKLVAELEEYLKQAENKVTKIKSSLSASE